MMKRHFAMESVLNKKTFDHKKIGKLSGSCKKTSGEDDLEVQERIMNFPVMNSLNFQWKLGGGT